MVETGVGMSKSLVDTFETGIEVCCRVLANFGANPVAE
jgi:hypothetical protein